MNKAAIDAAAKRWAQRLVDNVSTATQLDVEKDELPNVDDWRRNAEMLFREAIKHTLEIGYVAVRKA